MYIPHSKNKLEALGHKYNDYGNECEFFSLGFKAAFNIINEKLAEELNKLEEFQAHGERLMTLKIYKAKIAGYLKEMEQEYE